MYERLQHRVLQLELQEQALEGGASTSPSDWLELVARCRALRETLTSLHELSQFSRQCYELAADVCLRAGDFPEALKCLGQLNRTIFPALVAQSPVRGDGSSRCGGGRLAAMGWEGVGEEDADAAAATASAPDAAAVAASLGRPEFRRWPEVAAALVLYFRCCAGRAGHAFDTLATLCRLPAPLLATPELQLALRALSALEAGNFVAFFRLQTAAPPLVRRTMAAASGRARERALLCLGAAYRNVATDVVVRWLALEAPGGRPAVQALLGLAQALADRWAAREVLAKDQRLVSRKALTREAAPRRVHLSRSHLCPLQWLCLSAACAGSGASRRCCRTREPCVPGLRA